MDKKKIILTISIAAVLLISIILITYNRPRDLNSFIVVGCSIEAYIQEQDIGYLTINLENRNNTTKVLIVGDSELQKQLQQMELSNIIGVNIIMNIPASDLKNLHIDSDNPNIFNMLFNTNQYDNYFTVVGIS